jgi:hypothetical protein
VDERGQLAGVLHGLLDDLQAARPADNTEMSVNVECAGTNRQEVSSESLVEERPSKPPRPESCIVGGNAGGEALTGERAGRVSSREIDKSGAPTPFNTWKAKPRTSPSETSEGSARSQTPITHVRHLRGSREIPRPPGELPGRAGKSKDESRR